MTTDATVYEVYPLTMGGADSADFLLSLLPLPTTIVDTAWFLASDSRTRRERERTIVGYYMRACARLMVFELYRPISHIRTDVGGFIVADMGACSADGSLLFRSGVLCHGVVSCRGCAGLLLLLLPPAHGHNHNSSGSYHLCDTASISG